MTYLPASRFLTPILLLLFSCGNNTEPDAAISEEARKEIHSAVINRFHAMIKYSEAGELENVLSHFDPAGPGSYIEDGMRYASFEDMAVNHRATWKIQHQNYGVPETKVYVLSPHHALVVSSATLSTTHRDGTSFQPRAWSASILWVKNGDEWFIHSFHQYAGTLVPIQEDTEE